MKQSQGGCGRGIPEKILSPLLSKRIKTVEIGYQISKRQAYTPPPSIEDKTFPGQFFYFREKSMCQVFKTPKY